MQVSIVANHAWSFAIPLDGNANDHERVYNIIDSVSSWSKWQYNRWDPSRSRVSTYHLAEKKDLRFPSGLLKAVVGALESRGFSVVVNDERQYPPIATQPTADMLNGIVLRDYQLDAIKVGMEQRRGIMRVATGAGKTEILIGIIKTVEQFPVLWLTHTLDLMRQSNARIVDRLGMHEDDIGIVGDGTWRPNKITVCMVQTMNRMLDSKAVRDFLKDVKVLIADEAHHVRSDQFYDIAMACDAPYRFGVSATPLDMDDKSSVKLIGAMGDLIYDYTSNEAINDGFLARPKVTMVKVASGEDPKLAGLGDDWRPLYVNGIVKYKPRNDAVLAVCYRCMDEGRKTLVLVSEIQHGKFLEQEIERHYGNNDHHRFMYANASSMTRKRTFDELENGALNMLISTSLTDEGVDLPAIDAVVLAGAGKSRIKSIQRVGRGMRRGGKDLVVYDFMDEHHRKLIKHARKRSRDYQSMGAERVDVVGVGQL